MMELPNVE